MSTLPVVVPVSPEEIVAQLRAIRLQMVDFTLIPKPDVAALARVGHIDADFVQDAIIAIGASGQLSNAIGCTAEEYRLDTELAARSGAIVEELRTMLAGAQADVTLRRHRIAVTALQTYHVIRQLVRKKEHAALRPHLETMTRHNKFGKSRAKPAEPPLEPPVVPPVVPKPKQ